MSQNKQEWKAELEKKGWDTMLQSRLKFHGGMTVGGVSKCTGVSLQTAKKHCQKLVNEGLATWDKSWCTSELKDFRIKITKRGHELITDSK